MAKNGEMDKMAKWHNLEQKFFIIHNANLTENNKNLNLSHTF